MFNCRSKRDCVEDFTNNQHTPMEAFEGCLTAVNGNLEGSPVVNDEELLGHCGIKLVCIIFVQF